MSSWRAYAEHDDFGRGVRIKIVDDQYPGRYHLVTAVDQNQMTLRTEVPDEYGVQLDYRGLAFSTETAEAVYHALHRIFGQEADPAVFEALKVERGRVDKVLSTLLPADVQRNLGDPRRPQ